MSWLCDLIERNSSDPRERLELGQEFLSQLQVSHLPSDSTLLNDFCDLVTQWLAGSNFKVALLALEILDVAVDVSGDVLAPYLIERTPALVERLGDAKQSVREAAVQLLTTLANAPYSNVQIVFEKVAVGLSHRQWLVRINVMQVVKNILEQNKFYVEVQVNRLIPTLCKLMGDPNSEVRDSAANALVNIFCQYGDHMAKSIRQRQLIPESKYQMLMSRYKEAQEGAGPIVTTPSTSERSSRPQRRPLVPQKPGSPASAGRVLATTPRRPVMPEDQENIVGSAPPFQRASSVPAHRRPITVSGKNAGVAGAVSDETFQKAFLEVPKCNVFSAKELKEKLDGACATLQNADLDWDRRATALKMLRSVIIGGALDFTDFTTELREMEPAFLTSVKDLRSQVCREACVTLAFYCEKFEMKMAGLIEALMPTLINLLQNSAKVMASSANVTLQYVVKYVRSSKLLPHLKTAMASKSKEIRRSGATFLLMALTIWDSRIVEKNISIFMECIKAGVNDADPETRSTSRNMFSHLDQEYRQHAEVLFKSLDPSRQRSLSGFVSQSSSSQSIVSEKDSMPLTQKSSSYSLHRGAAFHFTGRSTSDIDTGSARRAYSHMTRGTAKWKPMPQINGTPVSSVRPGTIPHRIANVASSRKPAPLPRTPPSSVVRSQPGSRSTSPSPRVVSRTRTSIPNAAARNRSHTEELEDIPSADILKFEVAELNNALACCTVSSTSERKEGLKALYTIVCNEKYIDPLDLKKITERLNSMISEGSHKLLQAVSDLLIKLVQLHHDELNDWLNLLIPRLVTKHANDVLASNQDRYRAMLDTVRQCFDPEQQLHAIFRFIQDPVRNNVNFKIKLGLLRYLHEVMSGMDRALSFKHSEVRSAILKIFQWLDDPKNSGLRETSERVICDMFAVNASDFTAMMATYDNSLRNQLQEIIQRNSNSKPKTNGFSSSDTHALIHDTAAQINDFVEGRRLPVSPIRYESASPRSPIDNGMMRRQSREDANCSLSGYILDPDRLASDEELQEELITKIGEELSHSNERTPERLQAMNVLSQITRDNLFSLWEKYFKKILLLLVENLNDADAAIRRTALKLLKEICYSQAPRFNYYAEMVFMRVLDATADESKFVVSAAEECGSVLATHVSSVICRKVLLAVIKSTDTAESKIYMAIKMLTKVLESLSADELLDILDEVAPPIVEAYNYESSSIRKESVGCLVKMHKIVGKDAMIPYISTLNRGKRALLDVYLNRMRGPSPVS